jgi:hypothetical protein
LVVLDELVDPDLLDVIRPADDRTDLHAEPLTRPPAALTEHDPVAALGVFRSNGDRLKLTALLDRLRHFIDLGGIDLAADVLGIGVHQLGIEKLDAISVSYGSLLTENVETGEVCHLWLPIRVMASSRNARMGGSEVRTSLSNRHTGTCSWIAWL